MQRHLLFTDERCTPTLHAVVRSGRAPPFGGTLSDDYLSPVQALNTRAALTHQVWMLMQVVIVRAHRMVRDAIAKTAVARIHLVRKARGNKRRQRAIDRHPVNTMLPEPCKNLCGVQNFLRIGKHPQDLEAIVSNAQPRFAKHGPILS